MRETRDRYSAVWYNETLKTTQSETAELGVHEFERYDRNYWYIKIWRNSVPRYTLPASEALQHIPSTVHVGQEAYILRLWKGYKARRGL